MNSSAVKVEPTDFMLRIGREVSGNSQVADLEFIRNCRPQDSGRWCSGSGISREVRNLYQLELLLNQLQTRRPRIGLPVHNFLRLFTVA